MRLFIKHATNKNTIIRSIKVAIIVGTLLSIINHFDSIASGSLTTTNIYQIILTYFVPYSVATYGAACQARHMELDKMKNV